MRRKKLRLRLWVIVVLFSFFLVISLHSVYQIITWYQDGKEVENLEEEIENLVDVVEKKDQEEENLPNSNLEGDSSLEPDEIEEKPVEPSDYYKFIQTPFIEVNFTELLKKNPDTVGYIKVENTNINYPIVFSGDNEYYLNHAFNKKANGAGWIFLDYRNNLDELGDNTIIYGHARLDNTMFGTLQKALKESWQKVEQNQVIRISTPKYNYVFQIFSIYTIQMESYYIRTSFNSIEEKEEWINTMVERNTSIIHTEVSTEDKFLTLSTCKNNSGERMVVQAKLIKQEVR